MPKQIHKIQEKFPKALGHPVFRDPGNPVFLVYKEKYTQFLDSGWLAESRKSRRVFWMSIEIQYMPGCREAKKSRIYWMARGIQEIQDLLQIFLEAQGSTGNPGFPECPVKSRKSRIFWELRIFSLEAGGQVNSEDPKKIQDFKIFMWFSPGDGECLGSSCRSVSNCGSGKV